jgi:hypothetical protein
MFDSGLARKLKAERLEQWPTPVPSMTFLQMSLFCKLVLTALAR